MKKRIGLFGGSFDPVHNGHREIVDSFLNSGQIDEMWILPAFHPPHKNRENLTGFEIRFEMTAAAFRDADHIRVLRTEEELPAPSYTLQTVSRLKEQYPGFRFFLCIGSDSLSQLHTWYRYRDLMNSCEILVAKRPDYPDPDPGTRAEKGITFIEHEPVSYSSTEIRKRISKGCPVDSMLPGRVKEIIDRHGLYR